MNDNSTPPSQTPPDWGFDTQYIVCNQCGWGYVLPQGVQPQRCPHCYQSELESLGASHASNENKLAHTAPPELVIPHALSAEQLSSRVEAFGRGIPFVPADLTSAYLAQRLKRIFLPVWLVDTSVRATWQFEAGFNYQVVSHQERFSDTAGGWKTQEVQETRIRWEPRLGKLERTYPNIPVPALEEHRALRTSLGDFDQSASQPYQPEAVSQSFVRLPDRSQEDAWSDAIPVLQAAAARECQAAVGADHQRDFRWSPEYTQRNWTLLLVPVFTTYYLDDDKKPQPVYINGQTGQTSGMRRASMKRAQRTTLLILAVALVLFLISAALALVGVAVPVLLPVGGVGALIAILVALGAIIPLGLAWQFNRSSPAL
jgi:hypothetical protein